MIDRKYIEIYGELYGGTPIVGEETRKFLDRVQSMRADDLLGDAMRRVGGRFAALKRKKADGIVAKPSLSDIQAEFWTLWREQKKSAAPEKHGDLACGMCQGFGWVWVMPPPYGWTKPWEVPDFREFCLSDVGGSLPCQQPCCCSKVYRDELQKSLRRGYMPPYVSIRSSFWPEWMPKFPGVERIGGDRMIVEYLKHNSGNGSK